MAAASYTFFAYVLRVSAPPRFEPLCAFLFALTSGNASLAEQMSCQSLYRLFNSAVKNNVEKN